MKFSEMQRPQHEQEEGGVRALYPGVARAFARLGVELGPESSISAATGGVGGHAGDGGGRWRT